MDQRAAHIATWLAVHHRAGGAAFRGDTVTQMLDLLARERQGLEIVGVDLRTAGGGEHIEQAADVMLAAKLARRSRLTVDTEY